MGEHAFGLFGVPFYALSFFLFIFSIAPMSQTGWLYGVCQIPVRNCEQSLNCMGDSTVRFQLTVDPFYATILWSPGTLEVTRVPWTSLNTKDLCATPGRLHSDYAVPNGFCSSSTNEFVYPSAVTTVQAMTILSIVFCPIAITASVVAAALSSPACSYVFVFSATATTAFAAAALGVWDSFAMPQNVIKGVTQTLPLWNATLVYQGQTLIRTKHSSRWEDVYGLTFTTTLVGSPPILGMSSAPGYSLWISGLVFVVLANVVACMMCVSVTKGRAASFDTASFGSGVYAPTTATATGSFPAPAYAPPPMVDLSGQRPTAPPPTPPGGYDKKDLVAL